MSLTLNQICGSIVAPRGFRAAGVFCDIKRLGTGKGSNKVQKRDLALIVSDKPASVAGMFTTNQVCAAPVKICIPRVKMGKAQVIVVNSGNANACTGHQGLKDAAEMARFTEEALALPVGSALVGSTGRIGLALPMDQVRAGIIEAAVYLGSTTEHASHAAEAIMTSDTRDKQIAVEFKLEGKTVRVGGICKGAGMIQPGMSRTGARPAAGLHATMLGFVTTDAAVEHKTLKACLEAAVAQSFNRISVDGDMSTNDTVIVLANGLAQNSEINSRSRDLAAFQEALNFVTLELAKMIVRDGEGVTRFVTVRVNGAASAADADAAARAVGNSELVKTSWFGGDPNWGRILSAAGTAGVAFDPRQTDIDMQGVAVCRGGLAAEFSEDDLKSKLDEPECSIQFRIRGRGRGRTRFWTCDFTEEYIRINASYRT